MVCKLTIPTVGFNHKINHVISFAKGIFFPVDQRFLNVLPIFFKNFVTLHLREVYLRVAKLRVVFMRMFRRSLRVAISYFTRFFLFYVALEEKEISTISRFFILQRFIACTNAKLAKKFVIILLYHAM